MVTQAVLKIKIYFMSNHIDCQLRVEGPAASIQKLKTELIYYAEGHYCVFLGRFTTYSMEFCIPRLIGSNTKKSPLYITDKIIPDFRFNYQRVKTAHDWLEYNGEFAPSIWVEPTWYRLSIAPEIMIVNFTAACYPPLNSIIYASILFSDLNFRFAFRDLSDMCEYGGVEGTNGVFKQIPQSGWVDSLTGRNVYNDYEMGWCYFDDHTSCTNKVEFAGVDFIDYEESHFWKDTDNGTAPQ